MRLPSGTKLGPYEIVAPLGAGGMGEVYRARDSRLGRDVAIKVLPEHLTTNAEVLARFEREARAISSLNHPHICTLHDVGRDGDTEYLVMELVEGETLAQRIGRGALPPADVLRFGGQIADALDRAHRAGIVHRDLKPGNVMITRSGAKLMDFGLARRADAAPVGSGSGAGVTIAALTQSPTVASPLTAQGTLVGTYLYMSPEQLEGKEADARSDLWALGCILYEMATGRRAFDGKSQASLIGAIMSSEPPPISTTSADIAPGLDAVVRACLAKDPEERIQTAHDAKLQLSWIAQPTSQTGATPALPKRHAQREPIAWAVAAAALIALVLVAWRGSATRPSRASQVRFEIPIPATVAAADLPRISPDGRMLAFAAQDSSNRTMVWLRPLNSLKANPLPGTENTLRPFWSPDSRYLGFIADGKLKKIPVSGGPPEVICDAPSGADVAWSRNGVILFDGRAGADPIWRVNAAGGVPDTLIPGYSLGVGWPEFLPDGRHFLYAAISPTAGTSILVGSVDGKKSRPLGITGSRVQYSPDGFVLYARDQTLLAQRFDVGGLKLRGEPFPVAQDLPVTANAQANFSVSDNGVLVYRAIGSVLSRLVWMDRSGRLLSEVAGAADYRAPALSPDGMRVAIRRRESTGSDMDVWVVDTRRGTTTRFTFDPGADSNPVWSPDGSRIAWSTTRGDAEDVRIKSSDGVGQDELLTKAGTNSSVLDWSRDGGTILFQNLDPKTRMDVYAVSTTGDHTPKPVLQSTFSEVRARFSPDGRWIAYQSNESGRPEVYVISFQGAPGKWQISTRGGTDPCWSHSGGELFYLTPDQALMSVPVPLSPSFQPGTPQELFRVRVETGLRRNVYCVAPDDQRFLFQVPVGETNTPITAVLGWREGAERK